jgi:translation elongation factor EF-Tu-like GTPase
MKPHFRAKVFARTPEQGGRRYPINWGYRPDLVFENDGQYYGALLLSTQPPGSPAISPGEGREIDFYLRSLASQVMPRLKIGSHFTMNEGTRAVADCVIVKIYRADN